MAIKIQQRRKIGVDTYEEMYPKTQADCVSVSSGGNLQTKLSDIDKKVTYELTCSKTGSTYALSEFPSVTGLVSCVFKADKDYAVNDGFTINGTDYTVQTLDGKALTAGAFKAGAVVPIIIDTAGKKINFKQAGGQLSLPAEAYVMIASYTANGTFTAPVSGKYRVTCIARGGSGGGIFQEGLAETLHGINGPGGGAGGAGQVTTMLAAGNTITITANGNASFGTIISAVPGNDGAVQPYGSSYTAVPGTNGYCTGEEITSFQPIAATSGTNQFTSGNGTADGGNGGAYNTAQSKFLSGEGGKGGDADSSLDGKTSVKASYSGTFPFGTGGGGGAYRCFYTLVNATTTEYVSQGGTGAPGGQAAVIIELILDEQ